MLVMNALLTGIFFFRSMKTNGKPMIEVDGLVRKIGDRAVLNDISFNVHRGDTLVIMGGSGWGRARTAAYDWLYEADCGNGETVWRRSHRDEGARDPPHPVAFGMLFSPVRCSRR